jgi:uncharacterized iron-regulated membrane protein
VLFPANFRRLNLKLHSWIALGLGLFLTPITLSGALLLCADPIDRLLAPQRYAVTGEALSEKLSVYIEKAASAVPGARITQIRRAAAAGSPLIVLARVNGEPEVPRQVADAMPHKGGQNERGGGGGSLLAIYFDPARARILDHADFRNSLVGKIHMFHATLFLPEIGRACVGWLGVALLSLSITGLLVWWPRRRSLLQALHYRQSNRESTNIHRSLGVIVAVPLAVAAATGIYLAFPQQMRPLLGSLFAMSPQPPRAFGAEPLAHPQRNVDEVFAAAADNSTDARLVSLSFPTRVSPVWRVETVNADGDLKTVAIEDATGARSVDTPRAGDVIAQWIRRVHYCNGMGFIWFAVLFVSGLSPLILLISGFLIWRGPRAAANIRAFTPRQDKLADPGPQMQ